MQADAFAFLIEPPFNVRDGTGAVTGCDVELARTVLGMIGAGTFELIETAFAELLPGLSDGRWRMTTGLFATDDRREVAAFSRPIWALPDGLLVQKGNPLGLTGYRAAARSATCVLAVVRDQVQHRTAIESGMADDRVRVFDTYTEAARAVIDGRVHAYASVARAHGAFLEHDRSGALDIVAVGADEKAPAFGCFGLAKTDDAFRLAIDDALAAYLGSAQHRAMMRGFGFSDAEVDLVAA